MGEATRVALLARPGAACERLQAALQEAGAELVLIADPTTADAAGVIAADVQAVLVALEPQVEEALDRFDAVLGDPAITVIFDEADLAAQREGWDAARWVRHLAAKLGQRGDVLPPGAGDPDDDIAGPGALEAPALEIDVAAFDLGNDVLDAPAAAAPGAMSFDPVSFDAVDFDATDSNAGANSTRFGAPAERTAPIAPADEAPDLDFDLSVFATEAQSLAEDVPGDGLDTTAPGGGLQLTDDLTEAVPDLDDFSFDLDLSALDAAIAAPAVDRAPAESVEPATRPEPAAVPESPAQPPSTATTTLSLEPQDLQADDSSTRDRFHRDLADIDARIAGMQLVDEPRARPARGNGVVLVLAGIGGPDAVRQLLGGLPTGFPRAVLIQQRLDGARHDKLVRQMQRATALPVQLAEAGMTVDAGNVYVLPADLGLETGDGLRFGGDAAALLANLPTSDSAIVLLSGSDPAVVDAAMAHALRGALVVGQSPDGCYDAAASTELIARGAESGAPPALAKKLAARWAA